MHLDGLVLTLIGSRAHRLLPGGLTAISYTGPISGAAIRLPALSVVDGDRFVVVAGHPGRKRWWRAFRHGPQPAHLVRDGQAVEVTGRLLAGSERQDAVETYVVAHPGSRRGIGPETPVIAFTTR